MDGWNINTTVGRPWKLYVVTGILGLIGVAVAIAYVISRLAPN